MSGPLAGIRVLDWTVWQQGPVACAMLGDLGADVIKIEQRGIGDPERGIESIQGVRSRLNGRTTFAFEVFNRNKRSITLDLQKQEAKEIVYKLVEKVDVFVTNFRRIVVSRLGLDYETLSQYNPRLVYAVASSWGPYGSEVNEASFDAAGLARSGIMSIWGEPDALHCLAGFGTGNQVGAMMTAYGVVAALVVRERQGIGQEVDASLLGSLIFQQSMTINFRTFLGVDWPQLSRAKGYNPLWNRYKCKDGKWIVFAMPQSDRYWSNFCKVVGIQHLEKDPAFENMDARDKNSAELIVILDKAFLGKTQLEWIKLCRANGIICAPLNTYSDLINDPQVLANDYITEFDHPTLGKIKTTGVPVKFSKTPGGISRKAPEFGEHTEEVLTQMLGYTWDQINELREQDVI